MEQAKADQASVTPSFVARSKTELLAHKWLVLCGLAIIGLGVWQGARMIAGPSIAVDRVKRGALVETVVATGSVQTPFRVQIASQITGTVAEVDVDQGQRVTLGQKLVTLEQAELKAAMVQFQGAVDQAEAHMRQLAELTLPTARASRKEAQATLLNAQQSFDRTAELTQHGFATRAALDAAQKDLDVGKTALRTADVQVYTASPGGSDYTTGQTMLRQAQSNLDGAISRLGYATITAPRAGVLITRAVERGSVVQAGAMLLVLAPDGETELLLAIDERNLGKLALAQTAIASADAYADKRFPAVVSYINPSVDITRASVEVKLKVADPPAYLRQDMTVSVDIEVGRANNALILPDRSVHDALSASPWVMVLRNGRAVRQPVTLGLQSNTQFEIKSGLAEGDTAIPATATVAAGDRAQAATP